MKSFSLKHQFQNVNGNGDNAYIFSKNLKQGATTSMETIRMESGKVEHPGDVFFSVFLIGARGRLKYYL